MLSYAFMFLHRDQCKHRARPQHALSMKERAGEVRALLLAHSKMTSFAFDDDSEKTTASITELVIVLESSPFFFKVSKISENFDDLLSTKYAKTLTMARCGSPDYNCNTMTCLD